VAANAFSIASFLGDVRTDNFRTDRCRTFKLGGGVGPYDLPWMSTYQGQKVKSQGHKVSDVSAARKL